MKHHVFSIVLLLFTLPLCACSAGSSPSGGSGTTNGVEGESVPRGSETAPDVPASGGSSSLSSSGASSSSSSNGTTCGSAQECAHYYCRCNDGAIVNSRFCKNGSCQLPSAHCESACQAFRHGGWSGSAGGGDKPTATSSSSTSSSGSASACSRDTECPEVTCGCTSGVRLRYQICRNDQSCATKNAQDCQSACSLENEGDWDGT
jgi:hypothetical protein